MLSDGYIDDEELATLLGMVNKVINDGYSLKSLATEQSDLRVILERFWCESIGFGGSSQSPNYRDRCL